MSNIFKLYTLICHLGIFQRDLLLVIMMCKTSYGLYNVIPYGIIMQPWSWFYPLIRGAVANTPLNDSAGPANLIYGQFYSQGLKCVSPTIKNKIHATSLSFFLNDGKIYS